MYRLFRAPCAMALGMLAYLNAASAQNATMPPVEAFGSLPAISRVQLSPDGKHISAIQTYHGRAAVVIYEVGAPPGTVPAILIDEMHYIIGARWANNDRLLVTIYQSTTPDERSSEYTARVYPYFRTFSVDVKAQNPVMLMQDSAFANANNSSSTITDVNLDDPDHVLMTLWAGHIGSFSRDLYSVDVTTGKAEQVMRGRVIPNSDNEYTIDWVMDGHGHVVGRVDQSEEPLTDHLKVLKDGNWQEAAAFDAEIDHGADMVGLSEDGTQIIRFETGEQAGTDGIVGYEIATGKTIPVYKDPKYDSDYLLVNDWTDRALAAVTVTDTYQVHFFDPKMQALQRGLQVAFPGQNAILVSQDQAMDKVIVQVSSTSQPWTYYLLDRNTHFAGRIGVSYPALRPADLGIVKPYPYKARDGLEIPAYITLPPGKAPKNLPAVIFPHGGPEARDSMDFNWWAQFMASRGYVVLQPNFRGSSGYGYAFRKAGFHEWGRKMQDDITDGVAKLVADGIADPRRICIVGASYGGYAALAGATFSPGLYACAVSYAGLSDLPLWLHQIEYDAGPHSQAMSYLASRVGTVSDDLDRLKATSPALHADQVRVPILLMHGRSDYTVRIEQSEEEYNALKAAGKTVDFIRFQGDEDHNLERADTRIRLLTEIEKFLAKYIGT